MAKYCKKFLRKLLTSRNFIEKPLQEFFNMFESFIKSFFWISRNLG